MSLTLHITTCLHGIFDIKVDPNETVAFLKSKIEKEKGYNTQLFILIYRGKLLKDESTISSFIKKNNNYIILFMRMNKTYDKYLTLEEVQKIKQKEEQLLLDLQEKYLQSLEQQKQSVHPPPPVQQPLPTIETLPVDPVALNQLLEMGFDLRRAKKALLLNQMDVNLAMEWLLNNAGSEVLDTELTLQELRRIAHDFQRAQELLQAQMDPRVNEAINANICTFSKTGDQFAFQTWFHCYTCDLTDNKGCCVVCAKICHQGHQLSEALLSSFFCDCGAGDGKNPCKCLHISTQPSAPQ